MLFFKFPFGPFQTKTLLIGCDKTKKAAIIDASPGATGAVLHKAETLGLTIEKILLTHSHWDHIADAREMQERTLAPLLVHPLDASNVEAPGIDKLPSLVFVKPAKVDGFLNDGDLIEIGLLRFLVIHTPGHSPGSICLYSKEENFLVAGDTLFKGSHGAVHLPTGEPEKMWASLEKLAKLPPITKVIPGHGPDTTIGEELCH